MKAINRVDLKVLVFFTSKYQILTRYIHREFLDPWEVFLWQAFSQPAKVEKKAPDPAPTLASAAQEDDREENEDDDVGGRLINKTK